MERNTQLKRGEKVVHQLDPDTRRITETVETNWLLAPLYGLAELYEDIHSGSMSTADKLFVLFVVIAIARAGIAG